MNELLEWLVKTANEDMEGLNNCISDFWETYCQDCFYPVPESANELLEAWQRAYIKKGESND